MARKRQNIFRKVMWFEKDTCDAAFYAKIESKREVSVHPRYKSGEYYSEKSKRDIQHESGLEEKFFKKLEGIKRVLYYWHQPIRAPYWRGNIRTHTTPDVGVIFKDLKVVIVEVKPLRSMLDYKVQMKVEGLLRYCAQNGCGLLFTDGTNTVENIRKVKCNKKLEKDILEVLKDHTLTEKECKEILKKHDAKQIELLKIILKNKLKYQSYPFKLELCCYENELFYQVFYKKKRYDDLMKERFAALFPSAS